MSNKWKLLIILSFIFIIITIVYYLLDTLDSQNGSYLIKDLRQLIEEKEDEEKIIINFQSLTDFKWDKLYIFFPYTPTDEIINTLGFNWSKVEKTSIWCDEGINLLVFVSNERVVKYIEYPRNYGDFLSLNKKVFTPQEAIFELRKQGDWLIFVQIKY